MQKASIKAKGNLAVFATNKYLAKTLDIKVKTLKNINEMLCKQLYTSIQIYIHIYTKLPTVVWRVKCFYSTHTHIKMLY
jgi:hypothetical protein